MTSVSGNIGGTPSADGQKIFLQIPDSLLDTLTLSTTNENISFPELTVKVSIAFSSNGGDTAFESLNAGKAISIAVKSEDILGSYDDFAVLSEVKKSKSNLPGGKDGGEKMQDVSGNNGDENIEFAAEEFEAANEILRASEYGVWDGFYANDCFADFKFTAYMLRRFMFYIRNFGEGPGFWDWPRDLFYDEQAKGVRLQMNIDNRDTDEALFEKLKYLEGFCRE